MPSYRGVEQSEILRSIDDALELLETHSTGPECQKLIDQLRAGAGSPLAAIRNAADDQGLAAAIRGSGLNWLFICTAEVLQFHAVNNTDGKGLDTVQRLHAWGAGSGARAMAYYAIDGETDTWLAAAYARKTPMTEETLENLAAVAASLTQSEEALGKAFKAVMQLIELGAQGATDAEMAPVFLALDLHERHIAHGALAAVSLGGAEKNLEFERPMGRFGVVIEGMKERLVGSRDAIVDDIRSRVETALSPFYETDEVSMVGIGIITNDFDTSPQGIVFGASRRAAQAVADAVPELKVLDHEGRGIAPNAPKPPPPGFRL
jgi:hypothetical protein